jgi:hypothetical protein
MYPLGQVAVAGCSKQLFSRLIDAGDIPVMRATLRTGVPPCRASFAFLACRISPTLHVQPAGPSKCGPGGSGAGGGPSSRPDRTGTGHCQRQCRSSPGRATAPPGRAARLQEGDQLNQRPSHTVDGPDQHLLDPTSADRIQQRLLARSPVLPHRHRPVAEPVGDRPATVGGDGLRLLSGRCSGRDRRRRPSRLSQIAHVQEHVVHITCRRTMSNQCSGSIGLLVKAIPTQWRSLERVI